ncbi:MAG TPA: UDP-3-O-(3-hydroxymyristoyl)glucosamine N-acyltransferase [Candidatus Hydrogenedentes bacterium]|nr:UDP-3-O-(3-hydroxymyristoyl)glucosamine N-acyltransferase [Candidatus Hydrogenedentota bacterium]HOL78080.1 UDP-3-O-(3-hydroxymyristoyl)glucosamine N-acyltransferase [Candidatus Hydrogenedentota bacterium]HPO86934.1 UDP-3-O-(3-hydroxymyristoyl)glucosamine N-acyltransferase [Candidatus Hydrogenedentota bacterium]
MIATVADIAALVQGRVIGDETTPITGFSGIREAQPGDLTFLADSRYERFLQNTPAAAVLVRPEISQASCPIIQVDNPYDAFLRVVMQFCPSLSPLSPGIHPSAIIGNNVKLGDNVTVGAHAYIGDNSVIGDRTVIYPNVFIGANCNVGTNSIIYSNVSIREHVEIGARCIIHCGAVIGSDGFGFAFRNGKHEKIPQVGTVIIGDDVEIGANTTIDRATFGKTVIGTGTKIDNLVQIGHNTVIGKHCIVCGNVGISGSAILGDYVTVAAGAGVAGHLEVGAQSTIAALSGVTKSLPPKSIVSGFPAVDHEMEKRMKASLRRLPEALKTIRSLEKRIVELETLLHARETENHR